jgi:glycosyltransferase involved in cell wall biosynthesis
MSAERVRFLDITRLVARVDGGPLTGIDRVERAYLRALAASDGRFCLLSRAALGWIAIEGRHATQVLRWIDNVLSIPRPGLAGRLLSRPRRTPAFEAALRNLATARIRPGGLAAWLRRTAPSGGSWISVGHMNLADGTLASARQAGLRVAVMIHDTIPLDHPLWQGNSAPERFRAALDGAALHADLILCPSAAAAQSLKVHAPDARSVLVARLGVETAGPDPALIPATFQPRHASFAVLGTIEPRKNIGLLLNVWVQLQAHLPANSVPHLHVIGRRGWSSDALLGHLGRSAPHGHVIFHHTDLADATVMAMLHRARALLAPSRAEGFGFPPAEAASIGLPVVAADLAVTRELLGDYPHYLSPDDAAGWVQEILSLSAPGNKRTPLRLPGWTEHFNLVFNHF